MSLEYYNLCEELMARGINVIQENQQLKEQLEVSEKTRKQAIEFIKEKQRKDEFLELNEWQARELLQILDIDKGE